MKKTIKIFSVLLMSTVLLFSCSSGSGGGSTAVEDNSESHEKSGDSNGSSDEGTSDPAGGEESNQSTVDSETIYDVMYNHPSAGLISIDNNVKGKDFLEFAQNNNLVEGTDYTVNQETKRITLTDSGYNKVMESLSGGSESSGSVKTGNAPDAVLCTDEEVPYEWNYENRGVLSIILSSGTWKYTNISTTGSTIIDEIYAIYTIDTEGTGITCTEAYERRKVLLNDNQIEDLKGPYASEELEYITGNYQYDNVYCDFNKKILVMEKPINPTNRLKTDHGRELPLACVTTPSITVDSVNNPTKYKVDDGYGSYRYYVKY